ncbi:hypothetical protein CAMRE0001_0587 [Campylobacter rectus RM3267]|uniref:Uncharacterized protein n=1 Tax=Campylobacter rectus RM3267 TaxID=553218 RepID=B9D5R3_CAMRE|nr:hypothetical protein CAMRE0001_0587 [Campylobacter rectus RM3267]
MSKSPRGYKYNRGALRWRRGGKFELNLRNSTQILWIYGNVF